MNLAMKLFLTLRSIARHPLHRGAPMHAMADFCLAQVAVRRIPGEVCVEFPNNTRLLIPPFMKGAAHFITPGLCEFDEMGFVLHFIRPNELFVDIGANVGAYTVLASAVRAARSISFEPSPSTFHYLLKNVALNEIGDRVRAVNAALGKSKGEIRLTQNLGTENFVCPNAQGGDGVIVPLRRLDDEIRNEPPMLIKVDVEGFEADVFAGAMNTLCSSSLTAMVIERSGLGARYGYDEAALHADIRQLGFVPCAYAPMKRALLRIADDAVGNIIYVKDFDGAQKRLRESEPVQFRTFVI
jgi:FkbM family methyltransferase